MRSASQAGGSEQTAAKGQTENKDRIKGRSAEKGRSSEPEHGSGGAEDRAADGTGAGTAAGADAGVGDGTAAGSDVGAVSGTGTGANARAGAGTNARAGAGTNARTGANARAGAGTNARAGAGTNARTGANAGAGAGTNASAGTGAGAGERADETPLKETDRSAKRNRTPKSLKRDMYIIPLLVVAIFSLVFLLGLNIVSDIFVERQVNDNISSFLEYQLNKDDHLDRIEMAQEEHKDADVAKLYEEMNTLEAQYKNSSSSVAVQMIALDSPESIQEQGTDIEQKLYDYYRLHEEKFEDNDELEIRLDKSTFFLTTGHFRPNEDSEKQNILIYADLSAMKNFMKGINRMAIILLIIAAVFAVICGLISGNKTVNSLLKLNEYTMDIADRKEDRDRSGIVYKELNQTADTIEAMAAKLQESQEMQKSLFQNASHELRTPLMSIQGYAEGIKTGVLKDHVKASDIIITQSKKMSELVDEMLFLSRMDEESARMEFDYINMKEIIEYCKEEVYVMAEKKGVVIVESIPAAACYVNGNESQLIKAISNIMANGIRYAGSRLSVNMNNEDGNIILVVSDDGPGINEKDMPHIFERFYKGAGGNFGIGLSIAHDIIKRHGGDVTVKNEDGAVFTITIPEARTEYEARHGDDRHGTERYGAEQRGMDEMTSQQVRTDTAAHPADEGVRIPKEMQMPENIILPEDDK